MVLVHVLGSTAGATAASVSGIHSTSRFWLVDHSHTSVDQYNSRLAFTQ
jgi:hypothetical protein